MVKVTDTFRLGSPALAMCFAALMPTGCSRAPEKAVAPLLMAPDLDCGLHLDLRRRPKGIGGPLRACDLPIDKDIAKACAGRDFEGEFGDGKAGAQSRPYPSYQIRNARCAFSDANQQGAGCVFDYRRIGRDSTWQAGKAGLTYRYHDLSDDIAHDWFVTGWETDAVCGAGTIEMGDK